MEDVMRVLLSELWGTHAVREVTIWEDEAV